MSKKTLPVDINAGSIISINGGLYVVDEAIIESECFTTDQPEDWIEITLEIKCHGLRKEEFITKTEAQKVLKDEWISVEDRLPKPNEEVLVSWKTPAGKRLMMIAQYEHPEIILQEIPVTHWRYLPDAPEVEK